MPFFDSGGVRIHYRDAGAGQALVLIHGYASDLEHNWGATGWIDLLAAQRRVLALDVRGHGQSDKPHAPRAYGYSNMGADVVRLLDHLGIARAMLFGYSMGSSIAIELMLSRPERLLAVVLGGIAYDDGVEDPADRSSIVEALLADDPTRITNPMAAAYRHFADARGNDLAALAALMAGARAPVAPERFSKIKMPVLIVVGEQDEAIGDAQVLPRLIPGSRLLMLEGRNHLNAPTDPRFKQAVLDFIATCRA